MDPAQLFTSSVCPLIYYTKLHWSFLPFTCSPWNLKAPATWILSRPSQHGYFLPVFLATLALHCGTQTCL